MFKNKCNYNLISCVFILLLVLMLAGCGTDEELTFESIEGLSNGGDSDINSTWQEAFSNDVSDDNIYVFVCGSVASPGVYEMPAGSRAQDALALAGGFLDGADTMYVNLARELVDGERLYFPSLQEMPQWQNGFEEGNEDSSLGGLVNINKADLSKLCSIPGIGETRANAILEYRNKNGPFGSIDDLLKVSGIGSSTLDKIREYICVK